MLLWPGSIFGPSNRLFLFFYCSYQIAITVARTIDIASESFYAHFLENSFRQTPERDGTTFPPVDPGDERHRLLPAPIQVTSGRHYQPNSRKLLLLRIPFGPFRFFEILGTTTPPLSLSKSLSATIVALLASYQYRHAHRIHLACA